MTKRPNSQIQRWLSSPRRLYGAVRAALLWNRAITLITKLEYDAAVASLDRIEIYARSPVEVNILKSSALFASSRYEAAINQCDAAWNKLKRDKGIRREDKIYLRAYISETAFDAAEFEGLDVLTVKKVDLRAARLDGVSKWCKRIFPLRAHPDWTKEHED